MRGRFSKGNHSCGSWGFSFLSVPLFLFCLTPTGNGELVSRCIIGICHERESVLLASRKFNNWENQEDLSLLLGRAELPPVMTNPSSPSQDGAWTEFP